LRDLALALRLLATLGDQFIGQTHTGGDVFEDALESLDLGLETGEAEIAVGVEGEHQPIAGMPVEGLANAGGKGALTIRMEFDRVLDGGA